MTRTITVKGTGRVSFPADTVQLNLTLETTCKDYAALLAESARRIDALAATVARLGFAETDLKTLSYHTNTVNKSVRDASGDYREVFQGYRCTQQLCLTFDFVPERLAQVLTAVSSCTSQPSLDIEFTVKDPDAVREELLRAATRNARRKAEILTDASGVQLGELLTINYDWMDLALTSRSALLDAELCCCGTALPEMGRHMNPDDITVSDNATFVWEIH